MTDNPKESQQQTLLANEETEAGSEPGPLPVSNALVLTPGPGGGGGVN